MIHTSICIYTENNMVTFNPNQPFPMPSGLQQPEQSNPLKKYFRQPKMYITLPSKGRWYTEGALDMPPTGELPVFAMTAKDELSMKTPDALLNGQATVDVIQSCIPNIKNAWSVPSIDIDTILIAIRIATYGDNLELTTKLPVTGEEKDFVVDLKTVLADISSQQFDSSFKHNEFTFNLRPLTYKEFTENSIKTFEEQRLFKLVNDTSIPDEEKLAKFNESFRKLTDLTVFTLLKGIHSIEVEDEIVNNPKFIEEFINNAEKDLFRAILNHLTVQKNKFSIKPFKASTSKEDQEKGAPAMFEVPITFDQSNFFA